MLSPGLRVVRGPNWSWRNEDGCEGFVGTVRDINLPGTPHKTVIVHWDNGSRLNCRVGHEDKFDLRVIDNAQIGAKHKHVCDGCENGITGMRFHCICCEDYDLCYRCYHRDKHNLTHSFKRFDDTGSVGVNLPPRLNARKCELKGIFKDARVIRGFDWQWGNQDGGEGNIGTVVDIGNWENVSSRSTANVKWHLGNTEVYRIGHKGYCDIQCIEASSGGEYYPEHLPILGQRDEEMEWNGILDAIDRQQIMESGNTTSQVSDEASRHRQEQDPSLALLSSFEALYATVLMDYNKRVIASLLQEVSTSSNQLPLVDQFCRMSSEFKDKEIEEMYDIIKYMTNVPPLSLPEDVIKARYSETFIRTLISQGKKFLEDRYKVYMEAIVKENVAQPPQTETPGLYHLVHKFVGLRFKGEYLGLQDGMIDNRPIWPMVYYCLRLGDIPAAIYCLRENRLPELKEIVSILEKKLNTALSAEIDILEEDIRMVYHSVVRNCTDPFKRIVWAILGCYDEISEASKTVDDYLWFKLNLARVDCSGGGYIKYENLQFTLLEEQGESYFNAFTHPHKYFKLLMLTGQFEAAFEFLFRTEKFKVHAVHMAIAVNELNLLALPQENDASLISVNFLDPKPARRLNFILLIKNYVEGFEANSLSASLNYLFLLRNFSNPEGENLFEVMVADLAIRTKEYVKILGKFEQSSALGQHSRDFYRTIGLIDRFNTSNAFLGVVTKIKSQIMVKNENWEQLLDFYSTVNDQESVLHFMCTMLSQVAHLERSRGSLRNKVQEKAYIISGEYSRTGYNGHQNIYACFVKARRLLAFFDHYREKRYSEALKTLAVVQLVPLKLEELQRAVYNFQALNEDLAKVVPNVLLAVMTILTDQCEKIKTNAANQQHLRWVWEQANTIVNFAERLPVEIVGDTLSRLIQMEVFLHS